MPVLPLALYRRAVPLYASPKQLRHERYAAQQYRPDVPPHATDDPPALQQLDENRWRPAQKAKVVEHPEYAHATPAQLVPIERETRQEMHHKPAYVQLLEHDHVDSANLLPQHTTRSYPAIEDATLPLLDS